MNEKRINNPQAINIIEFIALLVSNKHEQLIRMILNMINATTSKEDSLLFSFSNKIKIYLSFFQVQSQYFLIMLQRQLIGIIYFTSMIKTDEIAFKPSIFVKIFIGYMYFMQGIYLAIVSTIVYVYPVFPGPDVLSNFSIAYLPFSFKYVTAPIVEKFTLKSYGRRKFWISLSLFATAILTYPLSLIANDQENYKVTIALLFVILVFICMGDVAIDAASIKQLEDPVLAGYLQAVMQPTGLIFGNFLIIKALNPTFWTFIGIEGPLCTIQTILSGISIIGFIIAVLIHIYYKQRIPDEEKQDQVPAFKTIFKYYLHFIRPKYSLCRHVLYYLFAAQGIKFFIANYGAQAIYRGFSKERLSEIQNVCILVAFGVNTILSKVITKQKIYTFIACLYFIELVAYSAIFYSGSFDENVITCTIFFMQIISYIKFLLHTTLTNGFGHSMFAGLCLTTLNSFCNLGNNSWLQLKVNGMFGYYNSVAGGLVLAWIIGIFLIPFLKWIREGEPQTHSEKIHEKQN